MKIIKFKTLAIIAMSLFLYGCATNTESVFKNEQGISRYCYLTNDHTIVSMGAVSEYTRCMNDAGAAGFRKVN